MLLLSPKTKKSRLVQRWCKSRSRTTLGWFIKKLGRKIHLIPRRINLPRWKGKKRLLGPGLLNPISHKRRKQDLSFFNSPRGSWTKDYQGCVAYAKQAYLASRDLFDLLMAKLYGSLLSRSTNFVLKKDSSLKFLYCTFLWVHFTPTESRLKVESKLLDRRQCQLAKP